MVLSKCAVWDSKKLKFIKMKEASGLLSSLGINTSFSKNPLVGIIKLMQGIERMKQWINFY